ncbi:DUF167 family protein [Marinicauda pacifica]|uniref:DUF167 family protein n=1 Tax=Marinicauda pacifica TaxID=1133559 RepID=UPI0035C864A0
MSEDRRAAISARAGGVLIRVRVTPKASNDTLEGIEAGADGVEYLSVKVRAVPDKGQANAAVLALLSRTLRYPKSALLLVAGATSRIKTIRLDGVTPAEVHARLAG